MSDELFIRYRMPYLANPGQDEFHYNLYNYIPNLGFNALASAAYGLILVAHLVWLARYSRTRWIQGFMVLFCAWEFCAYVLRAVSHGHPYRGDYFVAQFVITETGPFFIVIAMLFAFTKALESSKDGRVAAFGRPKVVTMLLVGYQTLVGITILIGAVLWCVGNARIVQEIPQQFIPNAGKYVILIGVGNQIGMLTVFLGTITWSLITLYRRPAIAERAADSTAAPHLATTSISRVLLVLLFLIAGMIWTRSIFRLAESIQGWFGPAWNSEALFGVFEFATMFTAASVWAVWPFAKECDVQGGKSRRLSNESERKLTSHV